MRATKWEILMIVMLTLFFTMFQERVIAEPAPIKPLPNIVGKYGIVLDKNENHIYFYKNGDEQFYPASMTKIMTALLLAENVKKGTTLKPASKNAVYQYPSNPVFMLKQGEKLKRDEALKALMVMSSNDVAVMIAEHVSGSEAAFAKKMTSRAKQLGAKHTNFVTASGLHDPKHVTTAYDMARIFQEVLKHPEITKYMKTNKATIQTNQQTVKVQSKSLTHSYEAIKFGKIGFTDQSGNCLVALVNSGGKEVISVVMKSRLPKHYEDVIEMGSFVTK